MKHLIFFIFLTGCAQITTQKEKDYVSLNAALNQAQASYLKGCVESLLDLKIPASFLTCRDKSLIHRQELDSIMNQDL